MQQQVAVGGTISATGPRAVMAAVIGNGLEWYNFMLYGVFASIIAKLYFPTANALTSLLLSLGTFAVGFFMRPLGAAVLGAYSDRNGRKAALSLTIMLMCIGTAMIALMPTYRADRPCRADPADGCAADAGVFHRRRNGQRHGLHARIRPGGSYRLLRKLGLCLLQSVHRTGLGCRHYRLARVQSRSAGDVGLARAVPARVADRPGRLRAAHAHRRSARASADA